MNVGAGSRSAKQISGASTILSSANFYDPAAGVWRQTWVGGRGLILELEGGWDGERMLLQGGTRPGGEGPVADRIGWSPVDDGEVLRVWEITRDGGETWEPIFTGTYRRSSQAGTADVRVPAPVAEYIEPRSRSL